MKHAEYRFVDVAIGGAHNRNRLVDCTKLGDPAKKKLRDAYMTYFRYPDDMVQHFRENGGSVKGYKGPAYADYIPVDIDTNDIQSATYHAIRMIEILGTYDVDINSLKIYFSGSKGFHVLIPSEIVKVEPSEDIHYRFRKFVSRIANGVKYDSTIYDKLRIFRIPNTINTKSGRYKIPLYPFELYNLKPDELLDMASQPREDWQPEEPEINESLASLYWREEETRTKQIDTTTNVKVKLCMHKMMQGVSEGERDNVALRVTTHLRASGLSPAMIWAALTEWNNHNKPPLTEPELERVFRQGLSHYDFGCHDEILKAYCDRKCLFYKGGV